MKELIESLVVMLTKELPEGYPKIVALTKLQETVFWAEKSLADDKLEKADAENKTK